MSADRPDDLDDVPPLRPVPPDRDEPVPLPEVKPGFGFWMAVVWCIFFFVVTQIVIGVACGIPLVLVAVFAEGVPNPADAGDMLKSDAVQLATILTVSCAHIGGLLFAWLILRWQLGRSWPRKIALTRLPSPTHAVLVVLGLVAMIALGSIVDQLVTKYIPSVQDLLKKVGVDFPMAGTEKLLPELINKTPWVLALFTVAVLPAFDEEFWCRGFIAHGLSFRYPAWAVVLITSFLFGCLHVDPRQGTGAMFLGVVMHLAYLATRSLWVPMYLHFCNNGLAVLHIHKGQPMFEILQPLEIILKQAPVLYTLATLALTAGVAYALYQTRCKLAPIDLGRPSWEPPSRSGIELPPSGSGTVVTHDGLSPVSVGLVLFGSAAFGLVLAFA